MATNTPDTDPKDGTGLGWPKRPQVGRRLGWPFASRVNPRARRAAVSRETESEDVSREAGAASVSCETDTSAPATSPEQVEQAGDAGESQPVDGAPDSTAHEVEDAYTPAESDLAATDAGGDAADGEPIDSGSSADTGEQPGPEGLSPAHAATGNVAPDELAPAEGSGAAPVGSVPPRRAAEEDPNADSPAAQAEASAPTPTDDHGAVHEGIDVTSSAPEPSVHDHRDLDGPDNSESAEAPSGADSPSSVGPESPDGDLPIAPSTSTGESPSDAGKDQTVDRPVSAMSDGTPLTAVPVRQEAGSSGVDSRDDGSPGRTGEQPASIDSPPETQSEDGDASELSAGDADETTTPAESAQIGEPDPASDQATGAAGSHSVAEDGAPTAVESPEPTAADAAPVDGGPAGPAPAGGEPADGQPAQESADADLPAGDPDVDSPAEAAADVPATVSRETRLKVDPMPAPIQTRVLVIANQKGGVGKTTTTVNIAAALAHGGLSVLVVDLDPQGNASTALGVEHPQGTPGTYEVLIDGKAIDDFVVDSPEGPNLKVLPATVDLAGAEIELVSVVARENKLKRALRTYLEEHPTDYVLLDCPPSLGLLTLNALVAAKEVLIPIQCEYYALEGVSQLMNTIDLVMGELNENLQLSTVLLTMYDARTRLAAQVADEVRAYFTEQTLPSVIPRSVRISEAPSYGQTVLSYHPESAGAVSYLQAAQEIARRGAKENA